MILLTPSDRLADGWRIEDTDSPGVPVVTKPRLVAETVAHMRADRTGLERLRGLCAVVNHAEARTETDFRQLGLPEAVTGHAAAIAQRGFRS